jgi:enolase-phosphatase E1
MLTPPGRHILLDVEGTTSSIRFVYEVMFGYVRAHLGAFLSARFADAEVREAAAMIGPGLDTPEKLRRRVLDLMDADSKDGGLKRLQGIMWREGFRSGAMRAHVYPDVPAALRRWNDSGRDVRIYSSGSVEAQRLFFGHSEAGDLTPHLRGHYDTAVGPKRSPDSYRAIAADIGVPPAGILFVSDIVAELDAARTAGLSTALSLRPENPPLPPGGENGHPAIRSFEEIG